MKDFLHNPVEGQPALLTRAGRNHAFAAGDQ